MNNINIQNNFVPYNESFELSKIDFIEPCLAYYSHIKQSNINITFFIKHKDEYTNNVEKQGDVIFISAPLYQQVFKWFRDVHGLELNILSTYRQNKTRKYFFNIELFIDNQFTKELFNCIDSKNELLFSTYEDAQVYGLKLLIQIIKSK